MLFFLIHLQKFRRFNNVFKKRVTVSHIEDGIKKEIDCKKLLVFPDTKNMTYELFQSKKAPVRFIQATT